MNGSVSTACDICAEDCIIEVDEEVEFFISDGIFDDNDAVELDVIESFDGNADLEEILNSEIELIKSDYHSCINCK